MWTPCITCFNLSLQGSGVDSVIYMVLFTASGTRSEDIKVGCHWNDDFEKGSEDHFDINNPGITEDVDRIEIRLADGPFKKDW